MIKSVDKNEAKRKTFRSSEFFKNEINMYQKVFKQMLAFQDEFNPKIKFDEVGVCLAAHYDGENDWIMMEDLTHQGFRMADRKAGMDYNLMKIALETLGKLHGLSLVYRNKCPTMFEQLLEHIEVFFFFFL